MNAGARGLDERCMPARIQRPDGRLRLPREKTPDSIFQAVGRLLQSAVVRGGAVMTGPLSGWIGGGVFLVAIFLPGLLLVVGSLPFWDRLRSRDGLGSATAGINAGVAGILAAAWVEPVFVSSIHSLADAALALACFVLLLSARISPAWVVVFAAQAASILAS